MKLGWFLTMALLIGGSGPAAADLMSSRPDPDLIRQATAQCRLGRVATPTGIVGISDPNTLDAAVDDLIQQTGVKWVRAEFHWSKIQPAPGGDFDWAPYDAMVERFNAAGIHVQGILTYIPEPMLNDWAEIDQGFQRFAEAAVRRYAPKGVHYWEVFNEPNLTGYGWLTRRQAPADFLGAYTLLLARANKAVRDNDPKGVVVLGGLASDNDRGISAEKTMAAIYGYGARSCFDVFAFHPYGYQGRFPEARARMEAIMAAGGDSKPLWFNEYGWTEQSAMDMATRGSASDNPMIAAFSQRGEADALFWFAAKDYSGRRGTPEFGLADFDLKKRKSFDTFRHLVDQIH